MPFGLTSAPATFQKMMDKVLSGLQGIEMLIYMDDIVIYAKDLRGHDIKVRKLFERLKGANLVLQPEKCEFLKLEVSYLGHIISKNGISPDPKKIQTVMDFEPPQCTKDVRSFLGTTGYYRRFIKGYANLSKHLAELTSKNVRFFWSPAHEKEFQTLKVCLCTEPIFPQYPEFEKSYKLNTDASDHAAGAVLLQENDGFDHPVAYFSKKFSGAELGYSTFEKECLAVLLAMKYFRPYLYGKKFTLI